MKKYAVRKCEEANECTSEEQEARARKRKGSTKHNKEQEGKQKHSRNSRENKHRNKNETLQGNRNNMKKLGMQATTRKGSELIINHQSKQMIDRSPFIVRVPSVSLS